jgi:hypothetical protein
MIGNGNSDFVVNPADSIYQALSTNGDGTGTISQNVDGSITPVLFYIQPPSNEKYRLRRMNVHAIDANWNNALQYGALGAALANGIKIYVRDDSGIIKDYTRDMTIKRTHDWALLAGVDSVNIGAATADPLLVRWTFARGASDIIIDGSNNERLIVEIPDDLTGLDEQLCEVQGFRIKLS